VLYPGEWEGSRVWFSKGWLTKRRNRPECHRAEWCGLLRVVLGVPGRREREREREREDFGVVG
jgi:hypothetical protein